MVNGLQLYTAFLTSGHQSALQYCLRFNHSYRRRGQPCRATASLWGALGVREVMLRDASTQLGGAGGRTSNLPITSQLPLLPEPRAAISYLYCLMYSIINSLDVTIITDYAAGPPSVPPGERGGEYFSHPARLCTFLLSAERLVRRERHCIERKDPGTEWSWDRSQGQFR